MVPELSVRSPTATRFIWSYGRGFVRVHWALLLWFAFTSLCRIGATIAGILLIRDFLTEVLSAPSGLAAWLVAEVGQSTALLVVVVALFATFVASALGAYGSQLAMQRLVRLIELDLMQKLITHLLRLPVAFFDRRRRGDLIEAVRHDASRTRVVAASFVEMFVLGAQVIAYGAAALWLSPRLLLMTVPVLLLAAAPGKWLVAQMRRRSGLARRHGYTLTDL